MFARLFDGDFKDFDNLEFPRRVVKINTRVLYSGRKQELHDLARHWRMFRRIFSCTLFHSVPLIRSLCVGYLIIFPDRPNDDVPRQFSSSSFRIDLLRLHRVTLKGVLVETPQQLRLLVSADGSAALLDPVLRSPADFFESGPVELNPPVCLQRLRNRCKRSGVRIFCRLAYEMGDAAAKGGGDLLQGGIGHPAFLDNPPNGVG